MVVATVAGVVEALLPMQYTKAMKWHKKPNKKREKRKRIVEWNDKTHTQFLGGLLVVYAIFVRFERGTLHSSIAWIVDTDAQYSNNNPLRCILMPARP